MEKRLKCTLLLSLKEISLRRVAVLLWNGPDVLAPVSKFQFDTYDLEENGTKWRDTAENKIRDEMLKLDLPESITKEMIERIRPIGLEIRKWIDSHEDYFLDPFNHRNPPYLTKFCWTSAGTINNRKTAEELVRCDELEIYCRYRLACLYCLEDDIPLLLEKLPERMKGFYRYKLTAPLLQYCWPYILKGELSKLDYLLTTSDRNPFTFYQCAFEYAAETGNKTASKYFFLKLSHEEREDSLMRAAHKVLTAIENINPHEYLEEFPKEKFSRISFLLPLMNPEQQMKVFASRPIDVLFSFLDWPWPDLFLENAGILWDLLPPNKYGDLLGKMYERYTKSDFYVPKLFRELFVQSPLDFKKCFVDEDPEFNHESVSSFLNMLFEFEDAETIGVIFRNLDPPRRSKLLFNQNFFEVLFDSVIEGKWHVVNVCLREATPSKEDKERLKGFFIEFLESNKDVIDCRGQNSKRFFQLLDEPDASADNKNKRNLEEWTLPSAGR